jgi:hypothetical protein
VVEVSAFPILETDRLILKEVTQDDANSIFTEVFNGYSKSA